MAEAKNTLRKLIKAVEDGEPVTIYRHGWEDGLAGSNPVPRRPLSVRPLASAAESKAGLAQRGVSGSGSLKGSYSLNHSSSTFTHGSTTSTVYGPPNFISVVSN